MGYKEFYYKSIEKLFSAAVGFYGDSLISFVIFGSVAKDTFRPDSDIDILIIAEGLPRGRAKRVQEFQQNIEDKISEDLKNFTKEGIYPFFSPIIKSKDEVRQGSPLFLDMTEGVKILYDKDNFFQEYISDFKARLNQLGAKKVYFKGGYYWLLKPDYKYGDIIEL